MAKISVRTQVPLHHSASSRLGYENQIIGRIDTHPILTATQMKYALTAFYSNQLERNGYAPRWERDGYCEGLANSSSRGIIDYHIRKAYSYQMVLYSVGDRRISLSLPDSEQKEIDFVDTSFFAAGAERQLPTPTQVRALSKDIGTRAQPTPVKYEELGLLVKFGPHITTVEALNLWTIKKVFGDDVPVPEVFGWRVDKDGYTFIYMELIGGPTLEECWDALDIREKRAINDQLCQITGKLRNLAQDPSKRFIGSINRGHLLDYVFIDQPKTGPFLSVRAFNDWFASLHQLRLGHKYDDPNRPFLPDSGEIKLTHGDLNRRNIIVASTSPIRVVIVDWQQSGWYPDYWEYCKAVFTCWYEDEWRRDYIDKFLQPQTEVYFVFSEYTMAMGAV